jgi:hypothetical protein
MWAIMFMLQVINIGGTLNTKEFVLMDTKAMSPLNIEPLNNTLKLFLKTPEIIYNFLVGFEPTKSELYVGIEGITWISEQGFLDFLLALSTFVYFFILTFIFAKATTIFHSEKEQGIFFIFSYIVYFIVIKVLWSM